MGVKHCSSVLLITVAGDWNFPNTQYVFSMLSSSPSTSLLPNPLPTTLTTVFPVTKPLTGDKLSTLYCPTTLKAMLLPTVSTPLLLTNTATLPRAIFGVLQVTELLEVTVAA